MTLPQDSRSPHRQQRWLELYNAGPSDIPPFAALEVVAPGSDRPESVGGYTPDDGITRLHVSLATKDNPCLTVINGPCLIPVAEARRVGTMDDPMLGLVASVSYATGTIVGLRKNSYFLEEEYCGYIVIGDYDAGTMTMRVKRWEECPTEMMVKALDCNYPGDTTKHAQPMKWDTASSCWVVDSSKDPVTICDCNRWLLALPGECFKVERNDCASGCYRPSFPYGLTRRVMITSVINCNDCKNVIIMYGADGCALSGSDCTINACNTSNRTLGCDANEYATLHCTPGLCAGGTPSCYGWLVPNVRPLAAVAFATADSCGVDATITGIVFKDVCEWIPRTAVTTAKNPAFLCWCVGDLLMLRWNECEWEVVQVQHHQIPVMIDMTDGDDIGTCEEMLSGASVSAGSSSCSIVFSTTKAIKSKTKKYTKNICIQYCCEPTVESDGPEILACGTAGNPVSIAFAKVEGITTLGWSCDPCPAMDPAYTTFYALCVGSETSIGATACDCDSCPTASGT